LPTRQLIDDVTGDWPVMIKRLDGHMSLANSVALRIAGVDKNTKDVPGGVIVRDAEGNPTGILKNAAQALVQRAIPAASELQIIEAIRAAQTYANAQGVTSVQDMTASPAVFRAYQTMLHNGQLRVRISGHHPLTTWQHLAEVGRERISLGSTTALLFEPYLDSPNTSGIASAELCDPQHMWHNVSSGDEAGLQIAIHAIGDKANHEVLGMYQRIEREHGERDRRLRIEHAQDLIAPDIPGSDGCM
jgi:predicted amidohydrolase YtcJ